MPKKKSHIFSVLKRSHLQAIGRVAAEWSLLEITFQLMIAEVASLDPTKTFILTKSGHIGIWMEMLRNMVSHVYIDSKIHDELRDLYAEVNRLQPERNAIIHTVWTTPVEMDFFGNSVPALATVAKGLGVPKRGKNITVTVTKTAAEMRKVAKEIEAASERLFQIVIALKRRASKRKQIAQALMGTNALAQPNPNKQNIPLATSQDSTIPLSRPQKK